MSLFCLLISQPPFPLRLCLSFISLWICLRISHSPSTMSYVTDRHFSRSLSLYVQGFFFASNQTKSPFWKTTFDFFFFYFILAPSTDTFLSSSATSFLLFLPLHTSWNNAVPVSWCNIMQTVRNPLENSPLPSKTAPKCNLAGVTEVRLRRSHFSTGRMLLVFPRLWAEAMEESRSMMPLPSLQVTATAWLKVCSLFFWFLKDLTHDDKLEVFLFLFVVDHMLVLLLVFIFAKFLSVNLIHEILRSHKCLENSVLVSVGVFGWVSNSQFSSKKSRRSFSCRISCVPPCFLRILSIVWGGGRL